MWGWAGVNVLFCMQWAAFWVVCVVLKFGGVLGRFHGP